MLQFTDVIGRHTRKAAALAAALTATVAFAPGAQAAQTAPAAKAQVVTPDSGCSPNIGLTTRSGNTIWGYGNLGSCNGTVDIYIQRSRWNGWQDMNHGIIHLHSDQHISYNCAGTGTHTFRTIEVWVDSSGNTQVKASNSIKESC